MAGRITDGANRAMINNGQNLRNINNKPGILFSSFARNGRLPVRYRQLLSGLWHTL
ncbi:MAG: hypothetical protein HND44_23400 [Chloroflexi bacterium]|nr:hypothetical protein [Chloroflexota bacterium]